VPALVLHGDFTTWNFLFEGDRLTAVLDFEFSHLDYRVADFALAWRGDQDEVLAGYEEVQPLTEMEWQLLVPVFWCWLFKGVRQQIEDILAGRVAPHGFDWQLKHLLRRSEAIRVHVGGLPEFG
jgi:Ser/Thr protein kinase RdoA (MazF antagonist)